MKQKIRLQAAAHQRSMEAEVREILSRAVEETEVRDSAEARRRRLEASVGIWKGRGSTDELMAMTREDKG